MQPDIMLPKKIVYLVDILENGQKGRGYRILSVIRNYGYNPYKKGIKSSSSLTNPYLSTVAFYPNKAKNPNKAISYSLYL